MTLIAGLDLETTGLLAAEHKIIEAYIGLWDLGSKSLIREFSTRIDPQRSILADASRVHHIFAGDLVGCPVFKDVAPKIRHELDAADFIVAHNGVGFDMPFVNKEFNDAGLPLIEKPIVDTFLESNWATFEGKRPNLGDLCLAMDVDYNPAEAHAAAYDVHCMIQCFFKALDWGYLKLPESGAAMEYSHAA